LLADGETNPDEEVLQNLGSQRIIQVFIHDTIGLGFTNWIRKIQYIKLMEIEASPHACDSAKKPIR